MHVRRLSRLVELLSTQPMRIERHGPGEYFWNTSFGPGEEYTFSAVMEPMPDGAHEMEIAFSRLGSLLRQPVGGKQALRVFAAATSFAERLLRAHLPDRLVFRASLHEPERLPLYKKMAITTAKKYHATRVTGEKTKHYMVYTIYLRQPQERE